MENYLEKEKGILSDERFLAGIRQSKTEDEIFQLAQETGYEGTHEQLADFMSQHMKKIEEKMKEWSESEEKIKQDKLLAIVKDERVFKLLETVKTPDEAYEIAKQNGYFGNFEDFFVTMESLYMSVKIAKEEEDNEEFALLTDEDLDLAAGGKQDALAITAEAAAGVMVTAVAAYAVCATVYAATAAAVCAAGVLAAGATIFSAAIATAAGASAAF